MSFGWGWEAGRILNPEDSNLKQVIKVLAFSIKNSKPFLEYINLKGY